LELKPSAALCRLTSFFSSIRIFIDFGGKGTIKLHTGNEIVQNLSSERPAEAEKETVSDETTPSGAPLRPSADA
jgi:hypothetical protein